MAIKIQKNTVMAIVGPTAVGKSDYAVKLAKKISGEIISADSRQVYKGLDIGSGKITKKEMRGVKHYMLDVVPPKKVYSAHDFAATARKHVDEILSRGKIPIIVGGTGFYIDALFGNVSLPNVPPNPKLRKKLYSLSAIALFEYIKKLDPKRAKTIDRHNKVRLIRAIEIAKHPKKKREEQVKLPYNVTWIGLTAERDVLRAKIARRVKKRLMSGMLAEVKNLHKKGVSWKRLNEFGLEYRLCAMYLQGKLSEAELVKMLEEKIYQYAMRQMRWFKRNKSIGWIKVLK